MDETQKANYPVLQVMKHCGLLRPKYLLFLPAWLTVCITSVIQTIVLGTSIDHHVQGAKGVLLWLFTCIGCTLYSYVFSICNRYVMNRCIEGRMKSLRVEAGYHLVNVPFKEIECMQRGDVLSRTMGDLEKIQTFLEWNISDFIITGVTGTFGIIIGMYTSWKLTLAVILTMPVIMMLNIISTKSLDGLMMTQKTETGKANGIAINYLQQLTSVKAFNLELLLSGKYFEQLKKIQKSEEKISYKRAALSFVQCIGSTLVYITLVVVGGILVFHHELTPGSFVIVLMSIQPIGKFAYEIQGFIYNYKECKTGSRRILDLMDLPDETVVVKHDFKPTVQSVKLGSDHFINLCDVSFDYQIPGSDGMKLHHVLSNINFTVQKGQKIALVGSSGCGKSTLIKLICALYHVADGQITLDGITYCDENIEKIREKIAVVLQENYLFPMSIADNIRCGKPDASMEEIIEAAKKVGIHDFIESLPNRYETILGEDGNTISGGQRQRICIARAYIKKPEVLVLDEPTAALDTETERIVSHSLEQLMEGKTTITVAHRLSTIKNSDLILCMDQGKIVEYGTHEELYQRKGRYYQLYQIQEDMAETA